MMGTLKNFGKKLKKNEWRVEFINNYARIKRWKKDFSFWISPVSSFFPPKKKIKDAVVITDCTRIFSEKQEIMAPSFLDNDPLQVRLIVL